MGHTYGHIEHDHGLLGSEAPDSDKLLYHC